MAKLRVVTSLLVLAVSGAATSTAFAYVAPCGVLQADGPGHHEWLFYADMCGICENATLSSGEPKCRPTPWYNFWSRGWAICGLDCIWARSMSQVCWVTRIDKAWHGVCFTLAQPRTVRCEVDGLFVGMLWARDIPLVRNVVQSGEASAIVELGVWELKDDGKRSLVTSVICKESDQELDLSEAATKEQAGMLLPAVFDGHYEGTIDSVALEASQRYLLCVDVTTKAKGGGYGLGGSDLETCLLRFDLTILAP